VDAEGVARWRMHTLGLAGKPAAGPEAVVEHLTAVQSQEYELAKWSLAQRLRKVHSADLDEAVDSGRILRTHVLRPTWHFVTPADIRWLLELTGPRILRSMASRLGAFGLTPAATDRTNGLIADALRGGNHLTRREIGALLAEEGIEVSSTRVSYIMSVAELEGVVCSGARKGKQQTYALLDELAPRTPPSDRDDSLVRLIVRYFTGHGPATIKDLRWWANLTIADIRRGIEAAGDQIQQATFEGTTYFFTERERVRPTRTVKAHLLQPYDEYIVGYTESRYVFDTSGRARPLWIAVERFDGFVVIGSQVAGRWRRTVDKERVLVRVALNRSVTADESDALEREVSAYGKFLRMAATLEE
jgi:Winged helix DNA-binding domain